MYYNKELIILYILYESANHSLYMYYSKVLIILYMYYSKVLIILYMYYSKVVRQLWQCSECFSPAVTMSRAKPVEFLPKYKFHAKSELKRLQHECVLLKTLYNLLFLVLSTSYISLVGVIRIFE